MLAGSLLVDVRETYASILREVLSEARRVLGFGREVELARDRAIELLDQPDRRVNATFRNRALDQSREGVEQIEVAGDGFGDPRALNLDHHLARAVFGRERRPVHLRDAGRCERLFVEEREQFGELGSERALDLLLDARERHRRHRIEQLLQLLNQVRRQHVRPGRGDLPELDERRPEVFEHEACAHLGEISRRSRSPRLSSSLSSLARSPRADGGVESLAFLGRPSPTRRTTSPKPWRTSTWEMARRRPMSRAAWTIETMALAGC